MLGYNYYEYGKYFNIYVEHYLKIILNLLRDTNNKVRDELKIYCFGVLSEFFISCPNETFKYFNNIINVIYVAFDICEVNPDDENLNNFILELKDKLLELMLCVFIAIKDAGQIEGFCLCAKRTIQFINKILRDEPKFNYWIVKNSLELIAHFCQSYRDNIKSILNLFLLKDEITKVIYN